MSNDLVFRDQRAAGAHAVLVSSAGVEIRDINSRNGRFINGARIGRALLHTALRPTRLARNQTPLKQS